MLTRHIAVFYLSLGLCGLLLAVGGPAANAADLPTARQFLRLSPGEQLRVRGLRMSPSDAPQVERLARNLKVPASGRVGLLLALGRFYTNDTLPSVALMRMQEAHQPARAARDSLLTCHAATELCYIYSVLHQPVKGIGYGQEAVRMAPATWRSYMRGRAYSMMAVCAQQQRDYPAALAFLQAHLRLLRHSPEWYRRATEYLSTADAHLQLGQFEAARQYYDSTRWAARQLVASGQAMPAYLRWTMGMFRAQQAAAEGRPLAAVRRFEPLLQEAIAEKDLFMQLDAIRGIGPPLMALGRYKEALAYQQRYGEVVEKMFEERSSRQAQEFEILYATHENERRLGQQQQRIAGLQAQARQGTARLRQRTALLLALLAGAALALVGVVLWQRARHRLAGRVAAQHMRTRLAADLHDEVGTLLTRVSMQAELLHELPPETAGPALDRLLNNSRAAASTMRDVVWSIDAHADTVGALLDRMRDYLDQLPPHLRAELHRDKQLLDEHPLPPDLRQHLYLVFKEAVTNAVRHASHATTLLVRLERRAGSLCLEVEDDGVARPPGTAAGRSGLGLRSMAQRAAALRGTLATGPLPGRGYRVRLLAPLPV